MPSVSGSIPPFYASYQPGYTPTGTGSGATGAGGASGGVADIVDVRAPRPGGNFTAEAGDRFALFDLFKTGGAYDSVAGYRVALRSDPASPAGGRLMLNGEDVTSRIDFSPVEFIGLTYEAGPDGARQDIVVVARNGTPQAGGGLANIVDSPAIQITATVTGTRSINAAAALRTTPGADEADVLRVVRDASIYTGLASGKRPTLTSVGQPQAPATPLAALAGAVGAFNAAGGSATTSRDLAELAALYGGAIGASRSTAPTAVNPDVAALALLLDAEAIGGARSAGDQRARQTVALLAYQKTT